MQTFAAPASLRGSQLAAEITAAGYLNVEVTLTGDEIVIDGRTAAGQALGKNSRDKVAAVIAAHVPDPAWTATPEIATSRTIEQRLDAALEQLRTFIAAPKPSTAAAQASAAYDATKVLARVAVGLIRLRLRRLDAAD